MNARDILFEPVAIGPLTAKNRFYQVPHCNGMGCMYPRAIAASRGVKAEGGWAVIATEECEIDPSSDVSPFVEARLWDEHDMRALQLSVDAVHEHGALAAIELTHNGHQSGNRYSRLPIMAVSDTPIGGCDPVQGYAMSKRDIAKVRAMHKRAALRARDIGFDIIYVYAAHDLSLPFHFLSRRHNRRGDEYGGDLQNRARLLRELLTETKDAVGDRCAVALRFAVDELLGDEGITADGEGREVVAMLADLPDLWDVNVSDWSNDSVTSRFGEQGAQEKYTQFVKQLTDKPVVGVGRFTSPDVMRAQIKRGVLDFIGAARPSIADPFLPKKIAEGREDDIRECIGCNICVAGDSVMHPLRCTQNPTTAEEFRRAWHPERMQNKTRDAHVLIVGGGAAGMEAAMSLGRRGVQVTLAEVGNALGGRVLKECRLPGLAAWKRVADYRAHQIGKLNNVAVHLQSKLSARQIAEFGGELAATDVLIATGSYWRADGFGRAHRKPIANDGGMPIMTPDDVMAGAEIKNQKVIIYDDDHFYLGGVLAEKLAAENQVTLVTPEVEVSHWCRHTLEQAKIERRLFECGVQLLPKHEALAFRGGNLHAQRINGGEKIALAADVCVLITSRKPNNDLYWQLVDADENPRDKNLRSVTRVGDCLAPATIAEAVYHAHRYAREFDEEVAAIPFKREIPR